MSQKEWNMIKSAEEFVRLRTSDDLKEQHRASDEPAPFEVWMEVIGKYPEMRKWVAHNKTNSGRILEILSEDPDEDVRWAVARRRAAGEKLLKKLAFDPDETVRHRVACNPKVTKEILTLLLEDPWEVIRESAAKRLAKLEEKTGEKIKPADPTRKIKK